MAYGSKAIASPARYLSSTLRERITATISALMCDTSGLHEMTAKDDMQ
jgi:hypothetical protein